MKPTKSKIGVYLDYSIAFLLERKDEENLITIIRPTEDDVAESPPPITSQRRNREFVRKVADMVKPFDRISLSGNQAAQTALIRQIADDKDHHIEVNALPPGNGRAEQRRLDFINSYFKD